MTNVLSNESSVTAAAIATAECSRQFASNATVVEKPNPRLLGGDYAGLLVEFSAKDGTLLPMPSRFVPDELLHWGQAPKSWEVLVSESFAVADQNSNTSNGRKTSFRRTTTTVLPGVGCGLDSLDTIRSTEFYGRENGDNGQTTILHLWHDDASGMGVIDSLVCCTQQATAAAATPSVHHTTEETVNIFRLETLFALPAESHRLRVSLEVSVKTFSKGGNNSGGDVDGGEDGDCHSYALSSSVPIRAHWERRYDTLSDTSGEELTTLALNAKDVNGHLDASTVFGLIGETLRQQKGRITAEVPQSQSQPSSSSPYHLEKLLRLSNHLSIRCGGIHHRDKENPSKVEAGWYLEVGLGDDDHDEDCNEEDEEEDDEESAGSPPQRIRSVRREFMGAEYCLSVM